MIGSVRKTMAVLAACAALFAVALLPAGAEPELGTADTNEAVDASAGASARLSLGLAHSCVVADDGFSYCWGSNDEGQLGAGAVGDPTIDGVPRQGAGDLLAISAGASHTCALTEAAEVLCWGANSEGQLGNGSASGPTSSPPLLTVKALTPTARKADEDAPPVLLPS